MAEKIDALLTSLARDAKYPGFEIALKVAEDYPRAWASGAEEFQFYMSALDDQDLYRNNRLTPTAWARVAALKKAGANSDLAFVAMRFHEDLKPAWEHGLLPGIRAAGYNVERADSVEHNDKIDDRIMAKIRECKFVVADATMQNVGVYFEAGFGLGLGRQVIWSVRRDDIENLHFDTRQFSHLVWQDPPDLARQVEKRILAVFGRGPVASP